MKLKDLLAKTDIFSGIGVALITSIINIIINILFKDGNADVMKYVVLSVVVFIVVIIVLSVKSHIVQNDLQNDRDYYKKETEELEEQCDEFEQKIEDCEQQIEELSQESDLLHSMLSIYDNTKSTINSILYLIKNNQKCDDKELLITIIKEIEFIFRNDMNSKNAKFNTSMFIQSYPRYYKILLSTNHSQGTINTLALDNDSFVGNTFKKKKYLYFDNISSLPSYIPFVDLDDNRTYNSIISIPFVLDNSTEFALVITSSNFDYLESVYNKYQDVIDMYLKLLCLSWFIYSDREKK